MSWLLIQCKQQTNSNKLSKSVSDQLKECFALFRKNKIQDHNDPVLSRMHGSSLYLYTSLSRSSIKLKEERCLCNQLTKSGSRPTWGVRV